MPEDLVSMRPNFSVFISVFWRGLLILRMAKQNPWTDNVDVNDNIT